MKTWGITIILVAAVLVVAPATLQFASAADKGAQSRDLSGLVITKAGETPVADAIVYLLNTKTRAIKTFITGPDGKYRFPGLATNADYQVYADLNGKRTETKTLSSFDSRAQASITLRMDTGK